LTGVVGRLRELLSGDVHSVLHLVASELGDVSLERAAMRNPGTIEFADAPNVKPVIPDDSRVGFLKLFLLRVLTKLLAFRSHNRYAVGYIGDRSAFVEEVRCLSQVAVLAGGDEVLDRVGAAFSNWNHMVNVELHAVAVAVSAAVAAGEAISLEHLEPRSRTDCHRRVEYFGHAGRIEVAR
jgi:hypothetical protein